MILLRNLLKEQMLKKVYPEEIRFAKIIGGDVSDNIYPVYFKQGDGTTKVKV